MVEDIEEVKKVQSLPFLQFLVGGGGQQKTVARAGEEKLP